MLTGPLILNLRPIGAMKCSVGPKESVSRDLMKGTTHHCILQKKGALCCLKRFIMFQHDIYA